MTESPQTSDRGRAAIQAEEQASKMTYTGLARWVIIVFTLLAAVVVRLEKFRVVEPKSASGHTIEDTTVTQSQVSTRLLRTRQRNVHR